MRARDLHPLCCLPADCPGGWCASGDRSPPPPQPQPAPTVAGVLYKWTNIGKGWRPRWFAIRGGVLTYSKIRRRAPAPAPDAVRLIGAADGAEGRPIGFVHLKVEELHRINRGAVKLLNPSHHKHRELHFPDLYKKLELRHLQSL